MVPSPLSGELRRHLRQLRTRTAREESGEVLLEGGRLLGDAIDAGARLTVCVVEEGREEQHAAMLQRLRENGVPVHGCTAKDAAAIAMTQHTQGVFAAAAWRVAALGDILPEGNEPRLVVALHEAADPGNLGTILRSSDWFGMPALLLSVGSVDPGNPKVVRASMGSLFRVAVAEYPDIPELARIATSRGYVLAATGVRPPGDHGRASVTLAPETPPVLPPRTILLLGSEAHGLPDEAFEHAALVLHIARRGGVESLNLAVAHGILLHTLTGRTL